ncbi:NADH-quinone oxidoreductase subunit J [Peribacillus deserti]|uniref:NADH-quinone oxidoreductase subunit J n=1 Tax=Peribacillus deserti TaxID=673318 RepID=A0A2N5MBH9_9BACI|nr:NADH-quinone oxidoreductase subunit J [Peribacillus deserti]PLT31711.1 NADH-quinone oxidoreductase subunit J [Peribacillus deserti]
MSLSGEMIAFIMLSLVAIIGGILLINLTKVVHMVIALVFTFVSVAGLYVLLSAEFLAAVQILIYSGAITIIMLFGIMLTRHNDSNEKTAGLWRKLMLFAGIAGFGLAVYAGIYNLDIPVQETKLHEDNTRQIGMALYSDHIIPFELTSVLLLAALIGAIILAKKDDEEKEGEE